MTIALNGRHRIEFEWEDIGFNTHEEENADVVELIRMGCKICNELDVDSFTITRFNNGVWEYATVVDIDDLKESISGY